MKRPMPYRVWYRWRGVYLNANSDRHALRIEAIEHARIRAAELAQNPEIKFVEIRQGQRQIEVIKDEETH